MQQIHALDNLRHPQRANPRKGCASGRDRERGKKDKSDMSQDMLVSHEAQMIKAGTFTNHKSAWRRAACTQCMYEMHSTHSPGLSAATASLLVIVDDGI